jgi:hypothetical protein
MPRRRRIGTALVKNNENTSAISRGEASLAVPKSLCQRHKTPILCTAYKNNEVGKITSEEQAGNKPDQAGPANPSAPGWHDAGRARRRALSITVDLE